MWFVNQISWLLEILFPSLSLSFSCEILCTRGCIDVNLSIHYPLIPFSHFSSPLKTKRMFMHTQQKLELSHNNNNNNKTVYISLYSIFDEHPKRNAHIYIVRILLLNSNRFFFLKIV